MHHALNTFGSLASVLDDADDLGLHTGATLHVPHGWPGQGDLLSACHGMGAGLAVLMVVCGIVYLLFGLYIFRVLVTINGTLLGIYLGALIGRSSGTEVPAGIVGGLLMATATWPVMKYAVAVLGGIVGAGIGAATWRLANLDPTFTWSGALTGIVFFGLLSFLLFRECVMTYTALQGAVMLVFGGLALMFKYDQFGRVLNHSFTGKPFLLPLVIFIPTLLGFIYQQAMFPAQAAQASPPPQKK